MFPPWFCCCLLELKVRVLRHLQRNVWDMLHVLCHERWWRCTLFLLTFLHRRLLWRRMDNMRSTIKVCPAYRMQRMRAHRHKWYVRCFRSSNAWKRPHARRRHRHVGSNHDWGSIVVWISKERRGRNYHIYWNLCRQDMSFATTEFSIISKVLTVYTEGHV